MFSKNKTDWNLLAKYMAGETNEKETAVIMTWVEERPENRALLKEIKSDWNKMDRMNERFDVDGAWSKLHSRISTTGEPVIERDFAGKQKYLHTQFLTPVRVAASLLLLALLGATLVIVSGRMQKVNIETANSEKSRVITLPDGSRVTMNENSKLTYAKHFNRKVREVSLTGEAFFDVSPDKNKPFRIYAGNACVKVLGTSFNVNARKNNGQVEVFVSTGIVELSEADNQNNRVLLHSGNIGLFSNKQVSSAKAIDENSITWKTGNMTFTNTRLTDVTSLLNDVFDVNIIITEPGIDSTRIIGSYQNDPLDDILEVICIQNHLTIAKSADTIYLSRQ
jgi:transmembrane sensor